MFDCDKKLHTVFWPYAMQKGQPEGARILAQCNAKRSTICLMMCAYSHVRYW